MLPLLADGQFYYGSQVDFGKNRVQYNDFEWQYFKFDKFETYFYTGGREIAIYTSKYAHDHINELEKFFDYYIRDKIQFVIYNKHDHFSQSNIGLNEDEAFNIGGVTQIVGSKVFIYYEGDYKKLEDQIRAGIAQVLINQMMYGGNWKEVVKNSALLSLPEWYIDGLISYVSKGWNIEIENRVKDGVKSGRYKKINRLTGDEAALAGHAMWYYIAETYGESVIPNILYMAKLSRNIENGYLFVLGLSLKSLTNEWQLYYNNVFSLNEKMASDPKGEPLKIKLRRNMKMYHPKLSPDGSKVAYVTNQLGQYKLWLYDVAKQKKKKILKEGHKLDRITDETYPVLAWHPSGEMLTFITEEKGALILNYYFPEEKKFERREIFNVEKVQHFSYSPSGRNIIFSGVNNGQTDLYLYNPIGNTQKKLTNDLYDDLSPQYISDHEIAFVTNRPDDTLRKVTKFDMEKLPGNEKNIFIFNLDAPSEKALFRVNDPSGYDESAPDHIGGDLTFLKQYNGVLNRYRARYDSAITHIDTVVHYRYFYQPRLASNYNRNVLEYQVNEKSKEFIELIFDNGKYRIFKRGLDEFQPILGQSRVNPVDTATKVSIPQRLESKDAVVLKEIPIDKVVYEKGEYDINDYPFPGTEGNKVQPGTDTLRVQKVDTLPKKPFKLPTQRIYYRAFASENSVTQLNNTFVNGQYQVFTGGPFISPGLGAVVKWGISDLLEDQKIYGGMRYAGSTREYFFGFQDLTHRLDKEYTIYRTELRQVKGYAIEDVNSNTINASFKWPFSEVAALQFVASGRYDQKVRKSTDLANLKEPNSNEYWGTLKTAYVFDNTRNVALNIRYGTRFKLFGEYYQEVNGSQSNIAVLGLDFRHYQKIHRELIWVNRVAASTSFGKEKIIYYLGSVDDWLNIGSTPKFNTKTKIDYSQNYRFQSLASNMRGFSQNIRNGNSFVVINSELRWPILNYFSAKPIRSEFLNNFQVVGFFDIGTAWNGWDPYSDENSLNKDVIESGPVKITLYNNNEPIVAGYGFGLRSKILGYFVRTDWGWGIENGVIKSPVFYLSLSLDI